MSKFTKGKWEVEHGAFDPEIICENKYLAFIYNLEHLEETEANARLIAAAPEMYKLLNFLSLYIFEYEKFYKPFPYELVKYAEEAKELLERIDGDESKGE